MTEQPTDPEILEDGFARDNAEVVTSVSVPVAPEADIAILALAEQADALLVYARAREITSLDDVRAATEDLSIIKALRDTLVAKRSSWTSPLEALKKGIIKTFERVTAPVLEADAITRKKILAYQALIREQAEEAARIAREEQALAERKAALNGTPAPAPVPIPTTETPTTMHGQLGTASQKTTWKFELVDITKVPAKYLILDEKLVGKIVRAGERDIPGLRIYPETGLQVRTKGV